MNANSRFRRLGAAAVVLAAACACLPVAAQSRGDSATWPTRAVRVITPAAPGGTTDVLARLFSDHLTRNLGQQFVVDNRASASGVIAAELTTNAAPDGQTLFLGYHQHTINAALLPKLPYHPVEDFTPITQLTAAGLLLVVHPSNPASSFEEFLGWAKNHKGPLNFGSAGVGSGGHLAGELFTLVTGVQAMHIPYKGSGPALAALLGQEYHFNFAGLLPGSRMVATGKLKGLAVTSPERSPGMPDMPTVAESGLPGFVVEGWYGILGPEGIPAPLVARIHRELIKVLHSPSVQKVIFGQGADAVGNTPHAFREYLRADLQKWEKVVKASGAKAY